jgi:hypothetical protein
MNALPFADWSEEDGDVLWWNFPITEPPYVGSPLSDDWPFKDEPVGAQELSQRDCLGWTRVDVPDHILSADGLHHRRFVQFPFNTLKPRDWRDESKDHGCEKLNPFDCVECHRIWSHHDPKVIPTEE